jgi:hypothetical protein
MSSANLPAEQMTDREIAEFYHAQTADGDKTLALIMKSEIEAKMDLATARPRNEPACKAQAVTLVRMDREIAEACTYSLPPRRSGEGTVGDPITGPSIRFAEIMMYAWGNMDVRTRIVGDDGQFIKVQAVCLDLQKNNTEGREAVRQIVGKKGFRYSLDLIKTTAAALTSIAKREAILAIIPRAVWNPVWRAAQMAAIGGEDKIAQERERYLAKIESRGISRDRVLATLGLKSIDDMTYEHIVWLQNLGKSIQDGGTTLEQAFPEPTPPAGNGGGSPADQLADRLAAKADPPAAELSGREVPAPSPPPSVGAAGVAPATTRQDDWLAKLRAFGFKDADIFRSLRIKDRSSMTDEHCEALADIEKHIGPGVTWAMALGVDQPAAAPDPGPASPTKGKGGSKNGGGKA